MSYLDKLKSNRSSSFDKLNQQLQKTMSNGYSNNDDDGYWKPEVDKAGNGYAVLRFLPAPDGEDTPFVKIHDHGFKGPGGWYIEKSLTTIGKEDPVSEYNSKLWNSGIEADKEIARAQKRRTSFVANVYVVTDSANPANDGKVFKFKFGKKIMEKLQEAMNPQYEGEVAINPFDLWEGADFKLKIRNYEGYRNYDRSEFSHPAPISNSAGKPLPDHELEAVLESMTSLLDLVDPKNYKSYDELKARMNKVLGFDGGPAQSTKTAENDSLELAATPHREKAPTPKPETSMLDDDDDTLDFFKSLASDD